MIIHLQSNDLISGIPYQLIWSLHQLTELATFRSALTKYLLTIPDSPSVVGYVGVNSNSLLDWSTNKSSRRTARVVSTDGLVENPQTLQRYQK